MEVSRLRDVKPLTKVCNINFEVHSKLKITVMWINSSLHIYNDIKFILKIGLMGNDQMVLFIHNCLLVVALASFNGFSYCGEATNLIEDFNDDMGSIKGEYFLVLMDYIRNLINGYHKRPNVCKQ